MQTKVEKAIKNILAFLLACILMMGDVIAVAENTITLTTRDEENVNQNIEAEELEVVEVSQSLITNKKYKIGEKMKQILQLAIEINANELNNGNLKENTVTVTTPIENIIPEEIYVSEQKSANFVSSTWEYVDGVLSINLVNDEIEKEKADKKDTLIITYVYAEDVDTSKILSKVSTSGKLYNGRKVIGEENIYEIENKEEIGDIVQINAEMQEIYKTELQKGNQQFTENVEINLSYKNLNLSDKIIVVDNLYNVYSGKRMLEIGSKYKQTVINKEELLNVIGENGTLVIKNADLIEEQETDASIIAKINKETEANEEGNIVINYVGNIENIQMEISLAEDEVEVKEETVENVEVTVEEKELKVENGKFKIEHVREFEKHENANKFDRQARTMDVSLVKTEEISKFSCISIGEIKDKVTVAELGLNTQNLVAGQTNELIATITMHTENLKNDLNKNPKYQIVLPADMQDVKLGDITILNNKYFIVEKYELVENENGQKVIIIELEGEQTEYISEAGNVQIVVPFEVTTAKLMPTINTTIELQYTNEKAESYENGLEQGQKVVDVAILSENDFIIAQEGTVGEETTLSYKTEVNTINLKKTEEKQEIAIKGTIINNTQTVEENIVIMGENEALNEITTSNGKVYYSETAEGPWSDTYIEGQKYYKIEIEKFNIGEVLEFTYNMPVPENLEESKQYESIFKVQKGEEIVKESKLIVAVEVEKIVETLGNSEIEVESENLEDVEINYETQLRKIDISKIDYVENDSIINHNFTIKNNSANDKTAIITFEIPECIDKSKTSIELWKINGYFGNEFEEVEFLDEIKYSEQNNIGSFEIALPKESQQLVIIEFIVDKYVSAKVETELKVYIEEKCIEFLSSETAIKPSDIQESFKSYFGDQELKSGQEIVLTKGDKIKYVTTIENKGEATDYVAIDETIPNEFRINKIQIYRNGILLDEYGDMKVNTSYISPKELKANDKIEIILIIELENDLEEDIILKRDSKVITKNKTIEAEQLNLTVKKEVSEKTDESTMPEIPEEPDEPSKPDESTTPDIPQIPEEPKIEKYSISGQAWLDKDKNGSKDENEDYLKGIEVNLLNASTNEKISTTITDTDGKYEFKDLEKGEYVVTFGYNAIKYNLTTYKKSGIAENKNSDVILTTQNASNIAKTEIIEITDKEASNIDIGLVLKETFDLEVTKGIKKITVKNGEGQTVYEYNNTGLAKIEIPSKYLVGTNLVIEYEIQIENKGDISGYVKTLTDNKPEGLKFASELNNSWYEGTDGKLYCIEFGADEIKSGEIRKVDLILTKEITDTKIQYITNEVELEDVFNEYLAEEKDTSNNKAEATLIVSIKTGVVKTNLGLWLACAIILGTGTYLINKKVIQKR